MAEVNYSFVEQRAPSMTDTFLTDLIIDIRCGTHELTDDQVTTLSAEATRRGIEDIFEAQGLATEKEF